MLHAKNTVRTNLLDDVFASSDLSVSMPKYKIPAKEHGSPSRLPGRRTTS